MSAAPEAAGAVPAAVLVRQFRGPAGCTLHVALAPDGRGLPLPANGGLRVVPRHQPCQGGARSLTRRLAAEMLLTHQLHHTGFSGAEMVLTGAQALDDGLLAWIAAVLDEYAGTVYTGADMGVTVRDMERLADMTPYVLNAVGSRTDPGTSTAFGVLGAVEAWARGPVAGLRALVHGAGKVGAVLAAELAAAGATVLVHDSVPHRARIAGCRTVRDWTAADLDVFLPCSVNDLIDPALARRLRCAAVIGSASAVLADEAATLRILAERGIVYLPTPLVNAGAVIAGSIEHYAPQVFRAADPAQVHAFVRSTVGESVTRLQAASAAAGTAPAPAGATTLVPALVPALLPGRPQEQFCGLRFAPDGPAGWALPDDGGSAAVSGAPRAAGGPP
ncbi:hypothetical protein [Streptomyces sp. CB00455]|uniref:hypothetical protein n=1 Tax=Streptomyces sp. CB00455 TaxID=1703927 RepID=UPI00093F73BB|nr:hypothetical protein [Streptomyces sp. CB00455]